MSKNRKKTFKLSSARTNGSSENVPAATKLEPQARRIFKNTTIRASALIFVVGLTTFFSGLGNAFLYDDIGQVVDNPLVHSLANIGTFFNSSTFYSGGGFLTGNYYRPIMTTAFSVLYNLFGPSSLAFHLAQLSLHIANAVILFLILRYLFRPMLALGLALIFLVHPENSQAVFYVACLQETLFFFFGILGIWMLIHFQDRPSPWHVTAAMLCFLCSMLSKETGILFVAIGLLYTYLSDRKRISSFLIGSATIIGIFLLLKIHATGLIGSNTHLAPIDNLGLWQRLLSIPSIILFYLGKFFFPLGLAHGYYWINTSVTIDGVILPALTDLAVAGIAIFFASYLKKKHLHRQLILFYFFSFWLAIGLMMHSQVIPLDATASETWFYFPMVGLLGMIGVVVESIPWKVKSRVPALSLVSLLLLLLAARTALRGFDWGDIPTLASHDLSASKDDYLSEYTMSMALTQQRDYASAKAYAERSIYMFPSAVGYNQLGIVEADLGDLASARSAFTHGLKIQKLSALYENAAQAYARDPNANRAEGIALTKAGLEKYPRDFLLWLVLGKLSYLQGDANTAALATQQAAKYGKVDSAALSRIGD